MRKSLTLFLATLIHLPCAGRAQETAARLPAVGHFAMRDDLSTLDPQAALDATSLSVISAIYDSLLEYDPLKTDPYSMRPCMLASMPVKEVSKDGRYSYLCELKPGVRFHDDPCFPGGTSREVTSADVHYTFQRICDPAVGSPYFGALAEVIEGMTEARSGVEGRRFNYSTSKVSGIEVLDARRFRIHLRKPYPQIVYWLAMPCTAPVARDAIEFYQGDESNRRRPGSPKLQAGGTGAFRLVGYTPQQRIRLGRVAGYATTVFPKDTADAPATLAGKALPILDEVDLLITRDNGPALDAFRRGDLDGISVNQDGFVELVDANGQLVPKYRDRGVTLGITKEPSTFFFALNLNDPVLGKNKKLRQALACAADADGLSHRFEKGVSPAAGQLLPPGIFGHDPARKNLYDLEKAKRLLAEAGYPDGRDANGQPLELELIASVADSSSNEQAEFNQRAFELLGLRIKLLKLPFSKTLERKDAGKFQILSGTGWGADYADPENFFQIFHSRSIPPEGQNASRYRNPEYDRVCDQMAVMENSPERLGLIRQLTDLLLEDCPVILTTHKQVRTVAQPWATPTHQNVLLNGGFKYLSVDPAMRARLRKEWAER